MIVVDSSVWIDYFNGRPTAEADALGRLPTPQLVVGDLIMTEVLQGFASEADFRGVERIFAALEFRRMLGHEIAIAAARNHRALRARGVTPRSTIDTIIATFCIAGGHDLLHCYHDFDPFERHLGLRVLRT
ncbi:type II toxin-antitoxin system VapC family toxin [Candidatus Binatus sp.]|jgi:predicted nucleic acid-binding protein|uniref:type II toxin-antitoxin system VapC family toxin n=1 Tax=Candidatus Binatus sp. TaxID=2811406 RepID=UPI003BD87681